MKNYWNPYYTNPEKYIYTTREEYDRIWKEAKSYEGKKIRVTLDTGVTRTGVLSRAMTCADGGIGLQMVDAFGYGMWVSPDFVKIEIVE